MSLSLPYQDFVRQAKTVPLFGQEFDKLIQKMFEMDKFLDNGPIIESLRGHANTTRLLETKETELRNILSNPETIIEGITQHQDSILLSIAYLAQAVRTLHDRCQKAEQKAAIA